jgi:hypothetical protein
MLTKSTFVIALVITPAANAPDGSFEATLAFLPFGANMKHLLVITMASEYVIDDTSPP